MRENKRIIIRNDTIMALEDERSIIRPQSNNKQRGNDDVIGVLNHDDLQLVITEN